MLLGYAPKLVHQELYRRLGSDVCAVTGGARRGEREQWGLAAGGCELHHAIEQLTCVHHLEGTGVPAPSATLNCMIEGSPRLLLCRGWCRRGVPAGQRTPVVSGDALRIKGRALLHLLCAELLQGTGDCAGGCRGCSGAPGPLVSTVKYDLEAYLLPVHSSVYVSRLDSQSAPQEHSLRSRRGLPPPFPTAEGLEQFLWCHLLSCMLR